MYFLGYRKDGGNQAYIRNPNLGSTHADKWYFPANDIDFLRRLAKALCSLADDIEGKIVPEREVI